MNFDDYDVARMLGFVVRIESSFYPEIAALYGARMKPGPPRGEPSSTRTRSKLKTANQQTRPAPAPP